MERCNELWSHSLHDMSQGMLSVLRWDVDTVLIFVFVLWYLCLCCYCSLVMVGYVDGWHWIIVGDILGVGNGCDYVLFCKKSGGLDL
jgi:hypothetical protein